MKRTFVLLVLLALAIPTVATAADGGFPLESGRDSFTIAFGGDVLIHSSVWRSAERFGRPYDFRPMFMPIRHLVAGADLAICHLENPLSPDSTNLSGFPRFNAPREIADGLVFAGFDGCSIASNHSNDRGPEGIANTIGVLEEVGLAHSGMRVEREDSLVAWYEVNGAAVASISATYGLNGISLPPGREWMVQMLDGDQILAEARSAKEAGADLVVVSVHCCVEYRTTPTDSQRVLAHKLIRSDDIDLVVTHHSHVVGPIEWVDDEPVIHGLGNLLSNQSARAGLPAHTQDGVLAIVTASLDEGGWRFTNVEVVPTWVDDGVAGHIIRTPGEDTVSFNRTMTAINTYGADVGIFTLPSLPIRVESRLR